ncbi:DUF92 domain-containing protein [Roseisolibacter agri]|uniref:DUF92 domain-containing protein n=1 Tax=Roseisolibacter agri TaxID=2014610 RepID=A0AA37QDN7_9BACT|nr:DUF92 domain-containing protein [Roseisolibacter agri]GLC24390.1 hypothetical protein rosag_09030 [Roseisolibacter agri]
MIERALVGLGIALVIAFGAHRAGSLDRSGASAAVVVGTASMAAGWTWGVLLLLFFGTGTALSRWRAREKAARTGGVVAKGGTRDAAQVLANGGLYAATALAGAGPWALDWPASWTVAWSGAAAGAIAAATADTWATEIGTLARGAPRSLRGWRPVPAGTSGAVSTPGTLAMLGGAAFIALALVLAGRTRDAALGALAGGIAGAMADTLAGAAVQERRWCPECAVGTERAEHDCGARTERAGGVPGLGNDAVNVLCGAVGAVAGALAALAAARTG